MTIYNKYKEDIEKTKFSAWDHNEQDKADLLNSLFKKEILIPVVKQSYLNCIDCIREHLNDSFDDEDNLQDDMNLGILAQKGKTDIYLQEQRKLIEND